MERQNTQTTKNYRIGDAAERLEIGIDTLRYYEKIRLVPRAPRGKGGVRFYTEPDLARLRFIRRAQGMGSVSTTSGCCSSCGVRREARVPRRGRWRRASSPRSPSA